MQYVLWEVNGRQRLVDAAEVAAADASPGQTVYLPCRAGMPLRIVYGAYLPQRGGVYKMPATTGELTFLDGAVCRRMRLVDAIIYAPVQSGHAVRLPFAALVECDASIGSGRHCLTAYAKPLGPDMMADIRNRQGIYAISAAEGRAKGLTRENWRSLVNEGRALAAGPPRNSCQCGCDD